MKKKKTVCKCDRLNRALVWHNHNNVVVAVTKRHAQDYAQSFHLTFQEFNTIFKSKLMSKSEFIKEFGNKYKPNIEKWHN